MRNWIFPQLQPQWMESILYLKKYTQKPLEGEQVLLKTLLKECDILGLFTDNASALRNRYTMALLGHIFNV